MRLPGVWPVALQLLALNEIKLAFPEASEDQQTVILFLAIMQVLQAGAMERLKLQELAEQRAKALEVLANVMQVVRDVEKTVLDNLKD